MKAVIRAENFKSLINNTKHFISKYSTNKLMGYIYLEVNAETNIIRATALDGHRVSVEYEKIIEADKSFNCFIKPNIPKITAYDMYVNLELVDNRLYVIVGEDITGYVQPAGEYFKTDKFISNVFSKEVTASIWVDPKLLQAAIKSVPNGYRQPIKIEIRGKKDPIVIIPKNKKDNIKAVLPVNVSEEE